MHAEHVAALEKTLFERRDATLVLSLEPGGFRVLARSSRSAAPTGPTRPTGRDRES